MRVIFVINISLLMTVGLTECKMKLKRLDNVEKTFLDLKKRCQRITGIEGDEYLWQLESEFKTEIYSMKEDATRLRQQYQARLDMLEESHRMSLEERQEHEEQTFLMLQESKKLYTIKEKEVFELNKEINRLRNVLERSEAINSNQNITIESNNKGSLLSTALKVFPTGLGVFTMLHWLFIAIKHRIRGSDRILSDYSETTANEKEDSRCIEDDEKTQNIVTSDKEVSSCIEYHDKLLNNMHEMQEPMEMCSTKCTEIDKRIQYMQKLLSDIKHYCEN